MMRAVNVDTADMREISEEVVKLGPHEREENGVTYQVHDADGWEFSVVELGHSRMLAITSFWQLGDTSGGIALLTGFSPEAARQIAEQLLIGADQLEMSAAEEAAAVLRKVASR